MLTRVGTLAMASRMVTPNVCMLLAILATSTKSDWQQTGHASDLENQRAAQSTWSLWPHDSHTFSLPVVTSPQKHSCMTGMAAVVVVVVYDTSAYVRVCWCRNAYGDAKVA